MSLSPESILKRLEELRKWQEEQEQIMVQKQVSQRELLNQEQQKLYEVFGLSMSSSTLNDSSAYRSPVHDFKSVDGVQELEQSDTESNQSEDAENADEIRFFVPPKEPQIDPIDATLVDKPEKQKTNNVKPKPFLKRGQGLTSRFKVHPDNFRLNNLPKYKYANHHKKAVFIEKLNTKTAEEKNPKRTKQTKSKQIPLEICLKKPQTTSPPIIVNKTQNTDDITSISQQPVNSKRNLFPSPLKLPSSSSSPALEQIAQSRPEIAWSKVLQSKNTKPISAAAARAASNLSLQDTPTREKIHQQQREIEELNLFEVLELDMDQTLTPPILRQFMRQQKEKEKEQKNIVRPEDPLVDKMSMQKKWIKPYPFDIDKPIVIDGTPSELEHGYTSHSDSDVEQEVCQKSAKGPVRFGENVIINANQSVTDDDFDGISDLPTPVAKQVLNTLQSKIESNKNEKLKTFQTFDVDTNRKNDFIAEKSEILIARLKELEQEIARFREQNTNLTKMKRDFELERFAFEAEKADLMGKLNDERVKMEVVLHDERMKVADERKKLDKRAKELAGPNRRERDEIKKLKDQVSELQKEMAGKDQKHVAAQSRLRSQIRSMEKDLKEYSFEIENLRKENKKTEMENIRLRRQGNNKLLQEINRNIAKLAPVTQADQRTELQQSSSTTTANKSTMNVERNNLKTKSTSAINDNAKKDGQIVAKVISHRNNSEKVINIRSKSVPNLVEAQQSKSINDIHDGSDESSSSSSEDGQYNLEYFKDKPNEVKDRPETVKSFFGKRQSMLNSSGGDGKDDSDLQSLKREIQNEDGSKDIWYPNGNLKKISADGMVIRMLYYNKDIKETNIHEGTVKYYYADTNTWHTSYLDGLEILEFPNGQTEHRYKDGSVEVHFPNGSIRLANPNNIDVAEEWKFPDGTTVIQRRDGDKLLTLPNGQREVHTKKHKRREYPDGTVKLVYPDGSQETRYSNGRIRLKDKEGKLVMDSEDAFAKE